MNESQATKYGDSSENTKYNISDDHVWPDEKTSETEDHLPAATVKSHTVVVLHRADHTDQERDIKYRYVLNAGKAIGILRLHRLAESNQFDPMGSIAPSDVPAVVRDQFADEMGADHWTDVVDVEQAEEYSYL